MGPYSVLLILAFGCFVVSVIALAVAFSTASW